MKAQLEGSEKTTKGSFLKTSTFPKENIERIHSYT